MQKWEYGYMYVVSASAPYLSLFLNFIAVSDAAGSRLLDGPPYQLTALNHLGAQGWIIADGSNTGGSFLQSGWIFDLIKKIEPRIEGITITSAHFMRRPGDVET
jgi:hypothetical protein